MKDLEVINVNLDSVKHAVNILAKRIYTPPLLFPTYGISDQTGRPHVEINSEGYHLVYCERGEEFERKTTHDIDELLYWIFADITFGMAVEYELYHRISGKDCRRLIFQKQLDLLNLIDESWETKREVEHSQILQSHPFNDK